MLRMLLRGGAALLLLLGPPGGAAGNERQVRQTLLWDAGYSMQSGAANMLSVHCALSRAEDRLLGTRWFPETSPAGKSLGMLGRAGKLLLIDRLADQGAVLVQQEVFGRGARLREFGFRGSTFHISWPPPYGDATGWTSRGRPHPSDRELGVSEELALLTGGSESSGILAGRLQSLWTARGRIHYREAALYLFAGGNLLATLMRSDGDADTTGTAGEVARYVARLNRNAGYGEIDDYRFHVRQLKQRAFVALADPFAIWALMGSLRTYLWEGRPWADLPMIRIGETGLLPGLRMLPAPFGPEYQLFGRLHTPRRTICVNLRLGEPVLYNLWGGAGLEISPLMAGRRWSLDAELAVWGQPALEIGGPGTQRTREGLGGAMGLTYHHALSPAGLLAGLHAKSPGYLAGEPLDAALRVTLGVSLAER